MLEPHSSFVDADEVRLHYLEWDPAVIRPAQLGSGQENSDNVPLVLFHGLGASADTWRLTAEYLCEQYHVLAFDLRGHGLSDQPEQGYDISLIAEDTISSMAQLGLGQIALVGHGWGARVALVLAARHPALVSHLILVDCPHVEPRHWPGMTRERFLQERILLDRYESRDAYLDVYREDLQDVWSSEIENIVCSYMCEMPDGQMVGRLRPACQVQIRESFWNDRALSYYSKLTCPVLLIPAAVKPEPGVEPPERLEQADDFAALKGQMAAQVARMIQRCSVLWMPQTSHDIQLQRPELLAHAILDFLQTS
ncbi:MAG TPA: alpha/beta hydrolase [Dictyobacter sp.]|jgi:pimeloyl-ACP methyl ester carboxylesterase|nr:alpha/beta hydrolase [Dictyobacter sp.]